MASDDSNQRYKKIVLLHSTEITEKGKICVRFFCKKDGKYIKHYFNTECVDNNTNINKNDNIIDDIVTIIPTFSNLIVNQPDDPSS